MRIKSTPVRDRKVFDLAQTKFDVFDNRGRGIPPGSVATAQEWSDTVDRYAPRTLNFRSVQVAPIEPEVILLAVG